MTTSSTEAANALVLNIFKNQDINQSFVDIFDFYEANNFPLDLINIPIIDEKRRTSRYFAVMTKEQVSLVDESIKLSDDAYLEAYQLREEKLILVNNSKESAFCQEAAAHLGLPETFSTIAVNTKISKHRYALFALVALGKNRYLEDHYQRLEEMHDVISTILQHILERMKMADIRTSLHVENAELRKRLGFLDDSQIVGIESGLSGVIEQIEQISPHDSPEDRSQVFSQSRHRSYNSLKVYRILALPLTSLNLPGDYATVSSR